MRLITWNCRNRGFCTKAARIAPLKPDILVVQEAERLDDVLLFEGQQQPTFWHHAQCDNSDRAVSSRRLARAAIASSTAIVRDTHCVAGEPGLSGRREAAVYLVSMRSGAILLFAMLCASCSASSPSQPTATPSQPTATPAAASFQGAWGGTYVIEQATATPSGNFQTMCVNGGNYVAGTTVGVAMTIAQNGQSLIGQYTAGDTTATFVSFLNADGGATITGSSTSIVWRHDYTFRLNPPTSGRITGTVSLTRTGSAGLIGSCLVESRSLSLQAK